MGKFDKCIGVVRKLAKDSGAFTKEEATELFQKLQNQANKLSQATADQKLKGLKDAAGEFAEQSILQAKVQKMRDALKSSVKADIYARLSHYKDPVEGLLTLWKGAENVRMGAHNSIPAYLKGARMLVEHRMAGELIDLKDINGNKTVSKMAAKGILDRSIAYHVAKLSDDSVKIPDDLHPVERDAGAKVATVLKKYQNEMLNRKNLQGCNIMDLAGRITRRQHDPLSLLKMGKEAWMKGIRPMIHPDTFDGAIPKEFLSSAFDAISSGVRKSFDGKPGDAFKEFSGNLAARLSKERLFKFVSPDAELAYRKMMRAPDTLFHTIFQEVGDGARDAALLQRMSPDPNGLWGEISNEVMLTNRTDPKTLNRLKSALSDNGRITNIFKDVTGFSSQDLNPTISRTFDGARTFWVATTQWLSTVKSLPDVAAGAAYLNHWGVPLWKSMGDFTKGWMDHFGITKGNAWEDYNRQSWFFAEHMQQAMTSSFRDTQGQRGWSRKTSNFVYTANQQMRWDAENRYSISQTVSRVMGYNADKSLAQITDKDVLRSFYKYDIDTNTWDTLRGSVTKFSSDGNHSYITADGVQKLPDSAIISYLSKKDVTPTPYAIERARNDLASKVSTIFTDSGDHVITLAGANERAIMNQGIQKGLVLRGALDIISQFRGYTLAGTYRTGASLIYGRGDNQTMAALRTKNASLYYGAEYIATGMAMWYISDTIKNAILGVGPRMFNSSNGGINQSNVQNGLTALAGSGGFGPYVDLATTDMGESPNQLLATLAGPTAGKISQMGYLAWKNTVAPAEAAATGKKTNFPAAADIRFAEDNIPGVSFPPIKMALNYAIMYHLENMLNPKGNKQHEKQLLNQTHQTYFFPPSKQ
jgi:hypothetical protein